MKSLILLTSLLFSIPSFADIIYCYSDKAIQETGPKGMKVNAEINLVVDRSTKVITSIVGHIFVQSPFTENEDISTENSYMGFFNMDSLSHNPAYRPNRYKGYTQFKKFDALHTAGLETGMWGTFVMNLNGGEKFDARYIFQAGDHMGGTVIFTCLAR